MLLVQAWDNLGLAPAGWGSHVMVLWRDFEIKRGVYDFAIVDDALAKRDRPCYLQLGFSMYAKNLRVPVDYTPQFHQDSIRLRSASGNSGYVPGYTPDWCAAYERAVAELAAQYNTHPRVAGYWHAAGWGQETTAAVNNSGGNWADLLKLLLPEDAYLAFLRTSTLAALDAWGDKPVYLPGAPSPGGVWGHRHREVIADLLSAGVGYMNCGLETDNATSFGLGERNGLGMYDIAYGVKHIGFEEGRRHATEPLEVYWLLLRALNWGADFVSLYGSISAPDAQMVSGLLPKPDTRWLVFRGQEFPDDAWRGGDGKVYGFGGEPGAWSAGLTWDGAGLLSFDPTRYDMGRWQLNSQGTLILGAPGLADGLYPATVYYPDSATQALQVEVRSEMFTLPPGTYHRVDVAPRVLTLEDRVNTLEAWVKQHDTVA